MSFDKAAFFDWLDEESDDRGYVKARLVEEEWPGFNEEYDLVGITCIFDPETGEALIPVRDYKYTVKYGHARD
jgi:hypothetical protein